MEALDDALANPPTRDTLRTFRSRGWFFCCSLGSRRETPSATGVLSAGLHQLAGKIEADRKTNPDLIRAISGSASDKRSRDSRYSTPRALEESCRDGGRPPWRPEYRVGDAQAMVSKMTALNSAGNLLDHELDVAINAISLSVHVAFEALFENSSMSAPWAGRVPHVKSNVGRLNDAAINDLVLGGRQYVEWLPVTRTIERARTFLALGQPFVRLWQGEQILQHLNRLQVVRNRLALGRKPSSTTTSRSPAGRRPTPSRTVAVEQDRRENKPPTDPRRHVGLVGSIVLLDRTPPNVGPALLDSSQTVLPGKYRCTNCSRVVHVASLVALGPCPRCAGSAVCAHCGHANRPSPPGRWSVSRLASARRRTRSFQAATCGLTTLQSAVEAYRRRTRSSVEPANGCRPEEHWWEGGRVGRGVEPQSGGSRSTCLSVAPGKACGRRTHHKYPSALTLKARRGGRQSEAADSSPRASSSTSAMARASRAIGGLAA